VTRRNDDERGALTVLVLAIGAFAFVAAWVVGALALLVATRASVSGAADAAALAAADDLATGDIAEACGHAAAIAYANRVALLTCEIAPGLDSVRVIVARTVRAPWPVVIHAGARAAVDDAAAAP
jgi:secretion/DNA translocation related TadE-like protein